jgi:transposase
MNISVIGIDLAKDIFAIHGVDKQGHTVLRKQLKRTEMTKFFANLGPWLIGMEACGSAQWARKLEAYGHSVKLMASQFVNPYVKTNKNRQNGKGLIDARHRLLPLHRKNHRHAPH